MNKQLSPSSPQPSILYVTDVLTVVLSVLFAGFSLLTIGKAEILVLGQRIDRGALMSAAFVLGALGPFVVIRLLHRRRSIVLQWLRVFYVQIYYFWFFDECIQLTNLIYDGRSLDSVFVAWDQALFGFQPALEFYRMLPQTPAVTELFFFSYFFYFFLFSGGIWLLFFRGRRTEALRFVSTVTMTFYVLYVFYVFFPVKGPKYYFDALHAMWYSNFDGYFFTSLLTTLFDNLTLSGAAFPSSHAAISTLSLLFNFAYQRKLAWVVLPITLLLYASTVYIYAHYAVDTIAGVAVGVACFILIPRLVDRVNAVVTRIEAPIGRLLFGENGL